MWFVISISFVRFSVSAKFSVNSHSEIAYFYSIFIGNVEISRSSRFRAFLVSMHLIIESQKICSASCSFVSLECIEPLISRVSMFLLSFSTFYSFRFLKFRDVMRWMWKMKLIHPLQYAEQRIPKEKKKKKKNMCHCSLSELECDRKGHESWLVCFSVWVGGGFVIPGRLANSLPVYISCTV